MIELDNKFLKKIRNEFSKKTIEFIKSGYDLNILEGDNNEWNIIQS